MGNLFTIFFLLVVSPVIAQVEPAQLANQLTSGKKSEKEKAESIFNWITSNISYTIFKKLPQGAVVITEPDEEGPLKPLDERVAIMVLKRRTALCDGYARLFKSLCDYGGLNAAIIQGYARNNGNKPGPRFGVNHYWNAVRIDSTWYLLDATWASGYVSWGGDEFIRNYDDTYFMSSPESFIKDHFPDDPRWTLLPDSKVPEEFRSSPFRHRSFGKYGFTFISPRSGIIDVNIGDTVFIKLEASREASGISPDMTIDSALFQFSPSWVFLKPDEKNAVAGTCHYTYTITTPGVQWLYLLYNDDIVLRYRLNIRSRKS